MLTDITQGIFKENFYTVTDSKDEIFKKHNIENTNLVNPNFRAMPTDNEKFHLPIAVTKISNNLNIENNIYDYVKLHLKDYLAHGNYNIFLSGGVDSENIVKMFIDLDIPFKTNIISYIHQGKILNNHDTYFAFKFCKDNNITPTVIDIDIIDFYNKGKAFELSQKYKCASPQYAPVIYAFDQIDGNILYTGYQKFFTNLFYVARKQNCSLESALEKYTNVDNIQAKVNLIEKDPDQWVFDYALNLRNDNSISDFYNCTTDMALTSTHNMLTSTDVTYDQLLDYYTYFFEGNMLFKKEYKYRDQVKMKYDFKIKNIYQPNGMSAKPRIKFTGFEGVKVWYSDKYIGKDMLLKQFDRYFRDNMSQKFYSDKFRYRWILNFITREDKNGH
jgi:hypothetical protein